MSEVQTSMSKVMSEDMSKLENERLQKVFAYLDEHDTITSTIASKLIDTTSKTASRLLNKAESCGMLRSEGKTSDKKYFRI